VHKEKTLLANIASLKLALSDQNLELLPDYEHRIGVLKELEFIDENRTVQLKGRVACEINSISELILTELILENTLAPYTPEEMTALLSSKKSRQRTEAHGGARTRTRRYLGDRRTGWEGARPVESCRFLQTG